MAEFLIKATSANWMDDTSKWVSKGVTQRMYDARSQVGDIIVVKPDSWVWGNKECLPQFVVGKVPNITEEEAKKYEEKLEQDEVITLQRTIDKKDWEDIKKQESFIIENRFTVIPTIIKTEEVERIKVVALADLTKSIDTFKYLPEDVSSEVNPNMGTVALKGIVDVHTVEGNAIRTYTLRKRKYQIDPNFIDGKSDVIEVKDISELNITIKNNTPITETVWQGKNG